jgi:hypothetical protein
VSLGKPAIFKMLKGFTLTSILKWKLYSPKCSSPFSACHWSEPERAITMNSSTSSMRLFEAAQQAESSTNLIEDLYSGKAFEEKKKDA